MSYFLFKKRFYRNYKISINLFLYAKIYLVNQMKISHKITNISGQNIVYIYVTVEDIYEFGKENLGKGENTDFLTKLRSYIKDNLKEVKKAAAVIVINGVVIGSLSLAAIYPNKKEKNFNNSNNVGQVQVYEEQEEKKEESIKEEVSTKKEEETELDKEEVKIEAKEKTNNVATNKAITTNKVTTNKAHTTTNKTTSTTSTKKPTASTATTTKPTTNTATSTSTTNPPTSTTTTTTKPSTSTTTVTSKPSTNNTTTVTSGRTIKFNNGGVISNIDLEEYVIGVVAAEMPASFHSEALKAQAVVARTYAMKKSSQGTTLVNSTSHQVYYTTAQMKSKWGSSYSTYYNKIKNAVNATKGQVLKYNGSYIDALYFSMSNGKTELPSYVWSTNYPYLQVVSSSWDEGLSAAKHTVSLTYAKLSEKLGITVNKDSEIKVLSKTAGDRVNEISIAGKTFTGIKVRSLLGLRSADFTISKNSTGVSITTIGFGHGVGMSQYGANGAAKAGYTYKQILSHYYSGVSLVHL